jgi:acetyl esterase/lipase
VVGGDSAGGGLTIALTLRLRDAGEELPGCLWLCSPWTDLTMSGATLATKDAVDPLIHKSYLEELARAYVPAAVARTDPRISPLFANLHGLPPTLIQVGSAETLLDDSVRLAGAAGAAGVAATLEIWPDMIHAWALWNAKLEAGRQSLISAGEFMRRHL